MHAALIQYPIFWEDKAANFEFVRDLLLGESFPENSLIVLPEMFATGFTMESEKVAEEDGGETEEFLTGLAKEKSVWIIGGAVKKKPGGAKPANCSVAASPQGEIVFRYEKTHLFSLGGEDANYTRGNAVSAFDLAGTKVSLSVCYDLRFPEVYRLGARQGAELFVVIANWPAPRTEHWLTLLRARAIENQACVIGVNRCGEDPDLSYLGRSVAVDHMGEVRSDAGGESGVFRAEFDFAALREWRDFFPALRDIHGDLSAADSI